MSETPKHPNPRDVLLYVSHSFARAGVAHKWCVRRARALPQGRFTCEFSRIVIPSALLNVLQITWGSCKSFGINSTDPNFQCGYLEVPMDYQDSSAGNARI